MSVDQVRKFLESATEYPDNTIIRIGNDELPLGSLRQLNASDRASLSERIKAAETREADLNQRQATIVDLAQKAQQAYDAAEQARRTATAQPVVDPLADPWNQPVKEELRKRDERYAALEAQLKSVQSTVGQAATVFMNREWQREYDAINFGKREKKPTKAELLKFSQDNRIVDGDGMPSVRGAWDKMSEGDRIEDARQEAMAKGREEGRMEAMASRVTPPGVSGMGQGPRSNAQRITPDTDILGDLYSESIKDPELRAMIESTGQAL